jgi:uncharacterized delta-60 repeat protein
VVRLKRSGVLDTTFNTGTGFSGTVSDLLLDSTGKLVVAGNFTVYNGLGINRIIRLNSDGSHDSSFTVTTGFDGTVSALALQSDGKILAAGNFANYNGNAVAKVARLNADGTFDSSFNPGAGPSTAASHMALQSDGKIILGGNFTTYDGNGSTRLVRVNTNGSWDNTFAIGTGLNSPPSALAVDSSNNVWVAGTFTTYNSGGVPNLIRIFPSGTRDTDPNIQGTDQPANAILPLSDGKVLLGGSFATYNSVTSNLGVLRLNTNFTIDTIFNNGGTGTGSTTGANTLAVDSNNMILTAGNFTAYNGRTFGRITRLNSMGSIDTHFGTSRPQPSSHIGSLKVSLLEYDALGGFLHSATPRISTSCLTNGSQGAHTSSSIFIPTGTSTNPIFGMQIRTYDDAACTGSSFESRYTFAGGQAGFASGPTVLQNITPSASTVSYSSTLFQQLYDANYHWFFFREVAQ